MKRYNSKIVHTQMFHVVAYNEKRVYEEVMLQSGIKEFR